MAIRPVAVSVPAEAASLGVVRAVAGGAGAAAGLSYEQIDDLKLGIDEAAGALLGVGIGSRLDCVLSTGSGRVEVRIGVDAAPPRSWPPSDWPASLGARVLEAVAGELAFETAPSRCDVRFVV